MTNYDVVRKLVGPIKPIGATEKDDDRFENLKSMCDMVENLLYDIDAVAFDNKDRHEYSMKRAGIYAEEFISKMFKELATKQ